MPSGMSEQIGGAARRSGPVYRLSHVRFHAPERPCLRVQRRKTVWSLLLHASTSRSPSPSAPSPPRPPPPPHPTRSLGRRRMHTIPLPDRRDSFRLHNAASSFAPPPANLRNASNAQGPPQPYVRVRVCGRTDVADPGACAVQVEEHRADRDPEACVSFCSPRPRRRPAGLTRSSRAAARWRGVPLCMTPSTAAG